MGIAEHARLAAEFESQLDTLLRLGYARLAGMPDEAFAELFAPLRARLGELPSAIAEAAVPCALVLDRAVVGPEDSMQLVEQDGRRGFVDMNPTEPAAFAPIAEIDVPSGPAYLVVGVDTGKETLNVTPDDALARFAARGRSPLTIEEGIAVLTHHPGVLRSMNAFSLPGSRRGDRRVPALWMSNGSPRLGWCWAGNPHTWLGSASCVSRVGG